MGLIPLGKEKEKPPIRVFLYGSLKKGQYNHKRFGMDRAKFLGTTAVPKFRLFHNDMYPAAVCDDKSPYSLVGEIYEVQEELFQDLRAVENGAGYVMVVVGTPLGEAFIFIQDSPPKWWKPVHPGRDSILLNWDRKEIPA